MTRNTRASVALNSAISNSPSTENFLNAFVGWISSSTDIAAAAISACSFDEKRILKVVLHSNDEVSIQKRQNTSIQKIYIEVDFYFLAAEPPDAWRPTATLKVS